MGLLSPKYKNDENEMDFDFHFPSSKKALIIFTKNPELGKVKTRLAKTIGDDSALKIYNFLIQHTVEITQNLNVDKYVFYSEEIHKNDAWDSEIFRKKLQHGEDLGERMQNAFDQIFEMGYKMAVIIGCDMYDWEKTDLETAFIALQDNDLIIGPALDGGYYLLGMKERNEHIFKSKNWGTSTVLEQTLKDLKNEKYLLLKERNDIDLYEDIEGQEVFRKFLPANLN